MTGYTDADVQLVAEALGALLNGVASDGRGWYRTEAESAACHTQARAALAALAEAGRLTPGGALRDEQWTVTYLYRETRREPEYGEVFDSRDEAERAFAMWAESYGFTDPVIYRRERLTAFGPWVEADGTP